MSVWPRFEMSIWPWLKMSAWPPFKMLVWAWLKMLVGPGFKMSVWPRFKMSLWPRFKMSVWPRLNDNMTMFDHSHFYQRVASLRMEKRDAVCFSHGSLTARYTERAQRDELPVPLFISFWFPRPDCLTTNFLHWANTLPQSPSQINGSIKSVNINVLLWGNSQRINVLLKNSLYLNAPYLNSGKAINSRAGQSYSVHFTFWGQGILPDERYPFNRPQSDGSNPLPAVDVHPPLWNISS